MTKVMKNHRMPQLSGFRLQLGVPAEAHATEITGHFLSLTRAVACGY